MTSHRRPSSQPIGSSNKVNLLPLKGNLTVEHRLALREWAIRLRNAGASWRDIRKVLGEGAKGWVTGKTLPSWKAAEKFWFNGGPKRARDLLAAQELLMRSYIAYIRARGGATFRMVAKHMHMDPKYVKQQLDALVEAGKLQKSVMGFYKVADNGE